MHSATNGATATPGRDEKLLKGFVVRNGGQRRQTLRTQRRRESRRSEATEQIKLARMLGSYLDRSTTFWSSLENAPRSLLSAIFQQRRGVRAGLPDLMIISARRRYARVVFVEIKSARGLASRVQKQVRDELVRAGAAWWMARSANAAMTAIRAEGVKFRRRWDPPRLAAWEGPWRDPHQRLPQEPRVAAQRRADQRRWNLRYRERKKAERMAAVA